MPEDADTSHLRERDRRVGLSLVTVGVTSKIALTMVVRQKAIFFMAPVYIDSCDEGRATGGRTVLAMSGGGPKYCGSAPGSP